MPIIIKKANGSILESNKVLKALQKVHGVQVGVKGGHFAPVARIPLGIFPFDLATGGGIPRSRVAIFTGPESCLDGDTYIQFETRRIDGSRHNHKGGSIEKLWHRFHRKPLPGKGGHLRPETRNAEYTAPCMNDEGRIFHNRILDVVCTGVKPCFRLTTAGGSQIVATGEHKFFTGTKYEPLSDLTVGSTVFIHNNTPYTCDPPVRKERPYLYVKHHPVAGIKITEGYVYHRLALSRAIMEAEQNGLEFEDYVERLDTGQLQGLVFLPREVHVHHLNEDCQDNSRQNLVLVSAEEHGREHATARHNNLRFMVVEDTVISIKEAGERSTYDLKMEFPFNNYVANGFVVHNSGKSLNMYMAMRTVQLQGQTAVLIDAEHAWDSAWGLSTGLDLDKLIVIQPDNAEQAADACADFLYAKDVGIVGVDSVSSMITQHEIDSEAGKMIVAGSSMQVSNMIHKAGVALTHEAKLKHYPSLLCISQTRYDIGKQKGDPEKMTGGNALKFASSLTVRFYGKNKMVEAVNKDKPTYKYVQGVIKKYRCPIIGINFEYDQCILPHGKLLRVGMVEAWNTVESYLKAQGSLTKKSTQGGWLLQGQEYKTLEVIKQRYNQEGPFQQQLQQLVTSTAVKIDTLQKGVKIDKETGEMV